MSFVNRQIDVIFYDNTKGQNESLTLKGHRVECNVVSPGGSYATQMNMRIFGMSLTAMNQYSSTGSALVLQEGVAFGVTVNAGDEGGAPNQVFTGDIFSSYIDFSSVPEVSFVINAIVGVTAKINAVDAKSWNGKVNVATAIESIAKSMKFGFLNNDNLQITLTDQAVGGSAMDQILTLAGNAGIPVTFDNNTVAIWANESSRDETVINVSAGLGMIGYPSYTDTGLTVKTIFNPNVFNGRRVNLTSEIPKAKGIFKVLSVSHDLTTLLANGAWFTTIQLLGTEVEKAGYVPTI